MHSKTRRHFPSAIAFRLLLNITLVLLMVLTSLGAAAADTPPPPDRMAADPYDQWSEEFLDFVPPRPKPSN